MKKFHAKRLLLGVSLLLMLVSCGQQQQEITNQVIEISQILKDSLAPDSRTELIEVSIIENKGQLVIEGETTHPDYKAAFFSTLKQENIPVEDRLNTLPDSSLGSKTWALVNVSVANLRGDPGHSQELVTQAVMGTPLRIFKKNGGWYFIQTPDAYLAWVDEAAIYPMDQEDLQQWKKEERLMYLGDFSVIRSRPEANSAAVSDLVLNSIIIQEEQTPSWLKVKLPDGRIGYVENTALVNFPDWMNTIQPDPLIFEQVGNNLIGRPYLWGGTSIKGMDCSGFVKTIFATGGLILDRDASQQVNMGRPVNTDDGFSRLLKGDLLFFGRKGSNETKERITHVGMYVSNGQFLHASGRVKKNSLHPGDENFSQHLVDIFVRAKRLVDSSSSDYFFSFKNHPWYH